MKTIDTKDKNRFEAIKWIDTFINQYTKGIKCKGIYLNGIANELIKKGKAYICTLTNDEWEEYKGNLQTPGKPRRPV